MNTPSGKVALASNKTTHLYLALLLMASLALYWGISTLSSHNISFWLTGNDYTELSLAHAISTDLWLTGQSPQRGYFQTTHPGIPFQIVSWLAYRLSLLFIHSSADQFENINMVLQSPELFWMINRILSIVIMAISILLAGLALYYCCGSIWSVFAIATFYCYPWALIYSYSLGNEIFALLFGTASAYLAYRSLEQQSNWWWPLLFGAACGLAYLNKLNYVAYFPGFLIACLTMVLFDRSVMMRAVSRCFLSLVGFALGLCGIGVAWLGWSGFRDMLDLHFAVLVHAGIGGQGERAVLTAAAIFAAMNQLWAGGNLYIMFIISTLILGVFVAFRGFVAQRRSPNKFAWVIYLLISTILCGAAALKHFSPHYFISTGAPIMFLAGFILANSHRSVRYAIIAATICMLIPALLAAERFYQDIQRTALEDEMLVRRVLQLPIKPDELRVWSYRLGAKQYLTRFIAHMVDNQRLKQMVTNAYPIDKSTAQWLNWDVYGTRRDGSIDEVPWRYSIIPKNCTEFPYNESSDNGSVVLSNSRTVVVERRSVVK